MTPIKQDGNATVILPQKEELKQKLVDTESKGDYVKNLLKTNTMFMRGKSGGQGTPKGFKQGGLQVMESRIGNSATRKGFGSTSNYSGSSAGSMGNGLASRFSVALSRVIGA